MYAQLGNTIFTTTLNMTSLTRQGERTWVEHATIEGKPQLQALGQKLDEVQISIHLHRRFVIPEEVITEIREYMTTGEVQPFITAAGDVIGDFVVVSIDEERRALAPDGSIIEANLTLSLKEYANPDITQDRKAEAVAAAIALEDNNPISSTVQTVNPETEALQDLRDSSAITNEAIKAGEEGDKRAEVRDHERRRVARKMGDVLPVIQKTRDGINALTGDKYTDTRTMDSHLNSAYTTAAQTRADALDTGGPSMGDVLAGARQVAISLEAARVESDKLRIYILEKR